VPIQSSHSLSRFEKVINYGKKGEPNGEFLPISITLGWAKKLDQAVRWMAGPG
jgi:hypothetical protein